ncbi:MAG: DUF1800 family protein [Saprospiraceae bacterium]
MPVPKYSGTFGQNELLHLLRRTLFGVNNADLDAFKGTTMDQVVDLLLSFTTDVPPPVKTYSVKVNNVLDPTAIDTEVQFGKTWVDTPINNQATSPDGYRKESYKSWRSMLMINQDRNLREQLTLFWHNHFSTDTREESSLMSYRHNKMLRDNCLSDLRTILINVSLSPSMLRYLNGYVNTSKAPDENYGRELQELFAIGKGAGSGYTEDDVKAAARVLTGWSFITTDYADSKKQGIPRTIPNNNPATPNEKTSRASNHDITAKSFSSFYGNKTIAAASPVNYDTMKAELDQLIDMILATDECARYIVRRFYVYFVHYNVTSDIEKNLIEPLAADYKASGYNTKQMLKSLFTSAAFYDSCVRGAMIKSPAVLTISVMRQFGMSKPSPSQLEAYYYLGTLLKNYTATMAQDLIDAPDVAGWPAYYQTPQFHEMWIDTATYPNRKNYCESLMRNGISPGTNFYEDVSKNLKFLIDFVAFAKTFSKPSDPNVLIDESSRLLFGAAISQSVKDQLKKNYLLQGQNTDYYWTNAFNAYVAKPNTTDPDAKKVPGILRDLYIDMVGAAEFNLI